MRKFMLGLIAVVFIVFTVKAWAALEIESINVNFDNNQATEYFQNGNFVETNSILSNGDTVQTNLFQPNGGSMTVSVTGSDFQKIFGGLISEQAVNMDAVTGATIGQTGVYIAQADQTVADFGNVQK